MWLYLQVKKRHGERSSIEVTEHTLRIDDGIIQPEKLYGRKFILDGHTYEFDRFAMNGEPTFVRMWKL